MTEMAHLLDARRRRILYRATHRGTAECDQLVGGFVSARLSIMSEAQLAELEALLAMPDPDLVAWISGRRPIPPEYDGSLIRAMHQAARR